MKINDLLKLYKIYLSPLNPPSCRFYPTCSEYAMCCFKYDGFILAFLKSILRILKCNQLFSGGVEYPTAKIPRLSNKIPHFAVQSFKQNHSLKTIDFWLIPSTNNKFYIIKTLKEKS